MALTRTIAKYIPTIGIGSVAILLGLSGTYTTGGDTCDLTPQNLLDPGALGVVIGQTEYGQPPQVPPNVQVAGGSGYEGYWVPGTTAANGKVQFFTNAGVELTNAAAYPAQLLGAVIYLILPQ